MLGTRLAERYELREELGRGGMGIVYRAWDPRLGRDVAVKLIPPVRLGGDDAERFRREARVVAQMDHPSIVPIHDYGQHDEALFFVMPVVEGETLRKRIEARDLSLGDAVEVAAQMAEALDYSHARGVIHRDVKPENVMVTRERGDLRVRVMDFGLARDVTESRLSFSEGMLVGTPTYLSPEQVAGTTIDSRADLYSLGVVLYECLAGNAPFHGGLHATLRAIAEEPPPPMSTHGQEVDEELESLVRQCLSKRPSERPRNGKELATALRSYGRGLRDSQLTQVVQGHRTPLLQGEELPLIGRDDEMALLVERLEAAAGGRAQVVLVGGDAGTGKTRLVHELARRAKQWGVPILRGRAAERDSGAPFQWFCELVQEYFEIGATGDERAPGPPLSDLAADLITLFPVLSELENLRSAAVGRSNLDPAILARGSLEEEGPYRVFELLASTLARLGGGAPLVILVESLHLGETAAEALRYIVPRLAPTPTLLIGTFRPSEVDRTHALLRLRESLQDEPRSCEIDLGPLAGDAYRRLLVALMGSEALRPSLVDALHEATEGNPFFTRELVRTLEESGEIRADASGTFVLAGEMGPSTRALPVTMHQAVERRLERLPSGPRRLLEMASVLGHGFEERFLEGVAAVDECSETFEDDLDCLVDQDLLREEGRARHGRLTFSSRILRDLLYDELPRRRRRALHRRAARTLEMGNKGRLERFYSQLLRHYYEGDVPEKTVEFGLLTAQAFLDAWSPEEAVRACRRALEFAEEDEVADAPRRRGELWSLVARAHLVRGRLSDALARADKAYSAFRAAEDDGRAAEAAMLAARVAWRGRRTDETRRWVHRGAELARRADMPELLLELLTLGATAASLRGEGALAQQLLEEAQELRPTESGEHEELVPIGGRLVSMLPGPVTSLDPGDLFGDWQKEVAALLFDTLMTTDDAGRLVPCLADRWEANAAGDRFEVHLRDDVRFSDGEPLRAEHVVAGFERAARRGGENIPAGILALLEDPIPETGLQSIEILDEQTLVFQLADPLPIFPALLSDPGTAVIRWQDDGQPVGTGLFRLATPLGDGDEPIHLERNPEDWRHAAVRLEGLELRPGLDGAAAAAALRSGEIDLARDLPPSELDTLLADPTFRGGLAEAPRRNTYFVLFNVHSPRAGDRQLRRALCGVVRPHDLVWRTLGRFAQPAVGWLPPGILGHDPGRRRRSLAQSWAKELVRQATPDGRGPLRLRAAVQPFLLERCATLVEGLLEEWRELGAEVVMESTTTEAYLERWGNPEGIDLLIGRWNADYADPDNFTHYLFDGRVGRLRHYFSSSEADRLLERARQHDRPETRRGMYRRFEDLITESHALLPLFHDIDYRLAGPAVRGLRLRTAQPYVDYVSLGKAPTPVAPETPVATPAAVETLHIPMAGKVSSLDPIAATPLEHAEVVPNVFETLTRINREAQVIPWLADRFESEDDGVRYRFHLRPDIRFHDGRRLTSRDVRYSFERVLRNPRSDRPQLPIVGAERLANLRRGELEGLRIVSANELVFDLVEPLGFFPALLSHPSFAIVPEGSESFDLPWREGCVGTGPFRVLRFESGGRIDLEAQESYWRPEFPRCQRLVFHGGLAADRILEEFRDGRLSLAADLRPEDVASLRRDATFASGYQEAPRLSTYFLALNSRQGPFAKRSRRRAFAEAMDLDALVAEEVGAQALRARGLLPPGLLGAEAPRASSEGIAGDLAGMCIQAVVNPAYDLLYGSFWDRLKGTFEGLGLEIATQYLESDDMIAASRAGEADLVVQRWIADYPDPDNFVMGMLHSRDGVLSGLVGHPDLDRLIEQGRRETDPALRHAVYQEIEGVIAREVLVIPLFHEQAYRFAQPGVEGLRLGGLTIPEVRYEMLSLDRGEGKSDGSRI